MLLGFCLSVELGAEDLSRLLMWMASVYQKSHKLTEPLSASGHDTSCSTRVDCTSAVLRGSYCRVNDSRASLTKAVFLR